jgi:hypothetical protein
MTNMGRIFLTMLVGLVFFLVKDPVVFINVNPVDFY